MEWSFGCSKSPQKVMHNSMKQMLLNCKIPMVRMQETLLKPGIKNHINPTNPNNHGSDNECVENGQMALNNAGRWWKNDIANWKINSPIRNIVKW
jgi:hypothetical protein